MRECGSLAEDRVTRLEPQGGLHRTLACLALFVALIAPSTSRGIGDDGIQNGTLGAPRVIGFEEFSPPVARELNVGAVLFSHGLRFATTGKSLLVIPNDQVNIPNSGSNTLSSANPFGEEFTVTASSGAEFDLISMLVAEGRNTTGDFFEFSATSVKLDGNFAMGGTCHR